MTVVDDGWVPSVNEIDEALGLYYQWLADASKVKPLEDALAAVDNTFAASSAKSTFEWIAKNSPDLFYDIDAGFSE